MFSPKVQSTLEKHFPASLPSRRRQVKQTSDAACLTGKLLLSIIKNI
jgi:hypothetical protein